MVPLSIIEEFLGQRSLALAGVSRSGKGFGHAIRKELTAKGYTLHLIHPQTDRVLGHPCARSLREVADQVGGVILVTAPAATVELIREAAEAGIKRIWIQQGAESEEALRLAETLGLTVVHHQCILMFAQPTGFPHSFHRWLLRIFGKLPR